MKKPPKIAGALSAMGELDKQKKLPSWLMKKGKGKKMKEKC
mgnify:CR=1 FL=1